MSNQKQLALAFIMYAQDYDERTVAAYYGNFRWPYLLFPYIKNTQVYNCPSDTRGVKYKNLLTYDTNVSYGLSNPLRIGLPSGVQAPALSQIGSPSTTVVFADANGWQVSPTGTEGTVLPPPRARHLETVNVAFCDGHVKSMHLSNLNARGTVPGHTGGIWLLWEYRYK